MSLPTSSVRLHRGCGVRPDLLGSPILPRCQHVLAVVAADQDRVVAGSVRIGIRGLPLPEGMLKTGPHVAERFDLRRPHDAEGLPVTVKALHAAPNLGPTLIKELAGFCGHGSLRLKEVSMCTH